MRIETTAAVWRDEPTCGGMWYCATEREGEPLARFYDDEEAAEVRFRGLRREVKSWYGPIPERPKPPEPMALLRRFRCVHGDERCRGVGVRINGTDYFWWEDTPEAPNPDQCPAGNDLEVEYTEWIDPEPTP